MHEAKINQWNDKCDIDSLDVKRGSTCLYLDNIDVKYNVSTV